MRPGSSSNSSSNKSSSGGTMVNPAGSAPSSSIVSSSSGSNSSNKSSVSPPAPGENVAYSPFAIGHNHHLIEYCRTSMSALAGSTAGIIGLTSLQGFAFYLVMVVILWLMIIGKAGPNYNRYFTSRWSILTNGFLGGLTTYVLFWTFLYGMVHVY